MNLALGEGGDVCKANAGHSGYIIPLIIPRLFHTQLAAFPKRRTNKTLI